MPTIDQFISGHDLRLKTRQTGRNPNMDDEWGQSAFHFSCTITRKKDAERVPYSMTFPFSQGAAHVHQSGEPKRPELADILDCLASDTSGVIDGQTFEDWAGDYGYDTDSREAEKTFHQVKNQTSQLSDLLGVEGLHTLVYDVERL